MPVEDVVGSAVIAEWKSILDVHDSAMDDEFFTLGGNSLLAVAFIGRVEKQLGIEFPAETLFFDGRLGEVISACRALYQSEARQ